MDSKFYAHLIFLCVLNLIFFFSGVVLNTLVIVTILKSTQLRKKLCNFMIMVLSCCDLLTVVACSSISLTLSTIKLTKNDDLYAKASQYRQLTYLPCGLSLLTLMVMCIERYPGIYHPIFHKTSVTKRRLLTLLAIFIILTSPLTIILRDDFVISREVVGVIVMVIFLPPFVFINYKLFKISRKMRRRNAPVPEYRRISLKNVNTCLLAVACLVFLSTPNIFFVVFGIVEGSKSDNARLSATWSGITFVMNCSFNSLIFFWKNKVLRDEGIKIIKKTKDVFFDHKYKDEQN